jgi:peptidoglycan/xylan/chitin deacetylase (PgdA/CDA1 family)
MLKENLVFSFDDGRKDDFKLAQLLKQYGFKATFYIPNNCELSIPDIKIISDYHEIGGHTVSHPMDLKLLTDRQLKFEIGHNKKTLEEITGKPVTSFCYPRGRYDERAIKVLKDLGFKDARTTVVLNTTPPKDLFRIQTSVHIHPDRKEYQGEYWLDVCKSVFDFAKKKGDQGYFHLWAHSWEISKFKLWEEFEQLLKYIKENK